MAQRQQPEENPPQRRERTGYQDGHQRAPIYQAPNFEDNLNHRNFPDHVLNFPADNIPYRPQLPDRGHHIDHHNFHYHGPGSQIPDFPPRPKQPYHLQPDHRLPTVGSYPSTPIYLNSPDGFATHLLRLLGPSSRTLSTLLADAKKARAPTSQVPAEDVVERALENRTLMHVSDGPSGGIWVVAAEKPEVVACLVAEMRGGWEILGVGKGGNEGMTFLRHPCGFGPEVEEEEKEKKKKRETETVRANAEENERNRERRRSERAWETDESTDEDNDEDNDEDIDEDIDENIYEDIDENIYEDSDEEPIDLRAEQFEGRNHRDWYRKRAPKDRGRAVGWPRAGFGPESGGRAEQVEKF